MSAGLRRETPVVRDEDTPPRPHEQVQAFLARSTPSPDPWSADIATVRADAREKVLAVTGEPVPVACVESIDVDGVPVRVYRPAGAERDVLVWAHGGGWMHGDLDTADGVARALASRAGCAVLVDRLPARARASLPGRPRRRLDRDHVGTAQLRQRGRRR